MNNGRFLLFLRMLLKFGFGLVCIGALLFLSAGSLQYGNGWLLLAALALPMAVFGGFLFFKDPDTLKRRMQAKEPDKKQRAVVAVSALMFVSSFVLAGLNYRFRWPGVPLFVSVAAVVVMLLGYGLFTAVILQNAYAARVVAVYENQKVISTGLYGLVRHPMYTATLLLYLSMPLILGSLIALLPMLFYPIVLVQRIKNEEALLLRELDGYKAYTEKVRYRLLPLIW